MRRGLQNVFVLEDVGLIFLLEDYEVGEYIEREIFQPVAAALAWSYKQMAKCMGSGISIEQYLLNLIDLNQSQTLLM